MTELRRERDVYADIHPFVAGANLTEVDGLMHFGEPADALVVLANVIDRDHLSVPSALMEELRSLVAAWGLIEHLPPTLR